MNINIYDFDKSIYDGDSSTDFIKYLIKKDKKLLLYLPKMLISFIKYKLKIINKETMKECFFNIVTRFDNIDDLVKEFWNINDSKIKPFFKNSRHSNDIIASASPFFLLEPIKKKYKVKDIIASQIDKKTGKYSGINCHGEEKINRLKEKYPDIKIEKMYSDDAKSDRPLLELAENSYIVKKNNIIKYEDYLKQNKNLYQKIINLYHKYEEIINYLIVGVLTTIVSLLTYYIVTITILNPNNPFELQLANIISWICAVVFAYIANRKYVFKSKNSNIKKEFTGFVGSRILTVLLDMLTMFIVVTVLHLNDKIGKLISQVIVTVGNYILSKLFVFKKNSCK